MEHLLCPGEVEAVLPDVGAVLGFVPFNIRCNSKRSYIQTGAAVRTAVSLDMHPSGDFSVTGVTVLKAFLHPVPFKDQMFSASRSIQPLNGGA